MNGPAAEHGTRGGRREVADPDGSATAAAILTPDAPCPWCGLYECPDRWEHARLDAASETTWRRRAT